MLQNGHSSCQELEPEPSRSCYPLYIPLDIPTSYQVVSDIDAFAQTIPSLNFNSTMIYLALVLYHDNSRYWGLLHLLK